MIDLTYRSNQSEIMDDFSQSGEVINQTLKELDSINTLLGGNAVSISGINQLLTNQSSNEFRIADIGCGGGDLMVQINDWAVKKKLKLNFLGVDANPSIIEYASTNTSEFKNIQYADLNIFSEAFKEMKFDVVHCSLFAHHFSQDELIRLLKQLMSQVKVGIVINDLHRHWISYFFTKWIIRTLSKSEMVRYDSVVSVARSFKKKDLLEVLDEAGISNYSLNWKWAFRWQLVIRK